MAYTPVVASKSSLCLKTKASVQQGHLTLCGGAVPRVHHCGVHNTVHHRRNFRRNISVVGFLGRATKGANSSRVIPEDTIGSAEYPKISQLDSILDLHNIDSVTDI